MVSGAGSGIGRATCARLAAEGARVVAADLDEAAARETAAALGENARGIALDVSARGQWDEVMSFTVEHFGGPDILVNCAGIVLIGTVEDTSLEDWHRIMAVNLDGTFFGCQAAVSVMKSRGGAIVNMSSISGLHGNADLFAYDASKGAVRSLTKEVAAYCGTRGYGIRCNSVHPGTVDTPMVRGFFGDDAKVAAGSYIAAQAIKRMAEPAEIAALIAFLVSDESAFATGAEFVIDGGSTAGSAWSFD